MTSNISIKIKDINTLDISEVAHIYDKVSRDNSYSDTSIRKELEKRYIDIQQGKHPEMAMALIWFGERLIGWVGTRPYKEKVDNKFVAVQTIECFVDSEHRRKGIAKLGLQALITTQKINRSKLVSVYRQNVIGLAKQCGCSNVVYCEP